MAGYTRHQVKSVRTRILLALDPDVGLSSYQVADKVGVNRKTVSRALSNLVKLGSAFNRPSPAGHASYFLNPKAKVIRNTAIVEKRPENELLAVASASVFWDRIARLRRMKERVIEEYHPLLDVVIHDYEVSIRAMEEVGEEEDDGDSQT